MHALIGLLGPAFFTFTAKGIGLTLLVVCATQAVDLLRIKREMEQQVEELPTAERDSARQELRARLKGALAESFARNVGLYSALVLIAAEISRTTGFLGTIQ
ncbi:MAG TPA: hypothetical protein ENJ43_02770 [Gammaproteobacteria bacterium]|nr:hypothetical protein [Gammaproteobacteria bacterium]